MRIPGRCSSRRTPRSWRWSGDGGSPSGSSATSSARTTQGGGAVRSALDCRASGRRVCAGRAFPHSTRSLRRAPGLPGRPRPLTRGLSGPPPALEDPMPRPLRVTLRAGVPPRRRRACRPSRTVGRHERQLVSRTSLAFCSRWLVSRLASAVPTRASVVYIRVVPEHESEHEHSGTRSGSPQAPRG